MTGLVISHLVLMAKLNLSLIFTLVLLNKLWCVLFEKKRNRFTCRGEVHFVNEKCVQCTEADLKVFLFQHSQELLLLTTL